MQRPVTRDELQSRLSGPSLQLVEVLPAEEFAWAHLPGARNLPLKQLDAEAVAGLDRRLPIVVYCNDFL